MIAWLDTLCQQVIAWHPTRRMLESCLRRRTHLFRSKTNRENLFRGQVGILRGLVHQAQHTRFGKEQNFARVRTVADFRRLTPLTTPAALLKQFWEPVFPWLDQTTWPAVCRIVDHPLGNCSYLPVTPAFVAGTAEVWLAGLGQVMRANPQQHLFAGRVLGLLDPVAEPLVDAAWSRFPWTLRPYLHVRHPNQLGSDDYRTRTTCLFASREQFAALLQRLHEQTGCTRLREVWPELIGVVLLRKPEDASLPPEQAGAVDGPTTLVEVVVEPQGIFAVEEPQRGTLRLLPEGGVFHELIDAEHRQRELPARIGLHEAEPGRVYELVSTTAGLWACRTGVGVCFDAPASLAVRFVTLPPLPAPVLAEEAAPAAFQSPMKPPRSRLISGVAVPPPSSILRMPWASPAER